MDMGIIKSLKDQYKRKLSNYALLNIEKDENIFNNLNILIAMVWLEKIWSNLDKVIIVNCWVKCGLYLLSDKNNEYEMVNDLKNDNEKSISLNNILFDEQFDKENLKNEDLKLVRKKLLEISNLLANRKNCYGILTKNLRHSDEMINILNKEVHGKESIVHFFSH